MGATLARLAQTGRAGGGGGVGVYPLGGPGRPSGGRLQSLPLRLFQECHVEIAVILLPPLVLLDGEGPNEPQATGLIGKDPHDASAPFDLLVEPLEHVSGLHVAVMREWQPIVGERFLDVLLNPSDKIAVAALPLLNPCLDVGLGLFELAAVVKPAQFL